MNGELFQPACNNLPISLTISQVLGSDFPSTNSSSKRSILPDFKKPVWIMSLTLAGSRKLIQTVFDYSFERAGDSFFIVTMQAPAHPFYFYTLLKNIFKSSSYCSNTTLSLLPPKPNNAKSMISFSCC